MRCKLGLVMHSRARRMLHVMLTISHISKKVKQVPQFHIIINTIRTVSSSYKYKTYITHRLNN